MYLHVSVCKASMYGHMWMYMEFIWNVYGIYMEYTYTAGSIYSKGISELKMEKVLFSGERVEVSITFISYFICFIIQHSISLIFNWPY